MPNKVYGPLDPRGWINTNRSPLAASLVGPGVTNPIEAVGRAGRMMADEGERAHTLSGGGGRHVDTIYDAERHARAGYRSAQDIGLIPTVLGGLGNEAFPMAKALATFNPTTIDQALQSARMDIHNNNVGLREAAAGRQIPTRSTPGLRTLR